MRARPSLVLRIALVLAMLAAVGACTSSPGQSGAPAGSQAASTQSKAPSAQPTKTPKITAEPTEAPSEEPTEAPTEEPTEAPTEAPSEEPTEAPSEQPTQGNNSPLVQKFLDQVTSADFQFAGTIGGAMNMTYSGQKVTATYTGTIKVNGADSAMSMTITVMGQKTTSENVTVGDYSYTRTGGGQWSKTARSSTSGSDFASVFGKIGALEDSGTVTWKGKQVHKLLPGGAEQLDPSIFGVGDTSTMQNIKFGLAYFAKADGTPAGMQFTMSGDVSVGGTMTPFTMTMDFTFDKLSGVTITAPI